MVILWRTSSRPIMLHYTGLWTQLSSDYVLSSFLSIFTSYMNKIQNPTTTLYNASVT